MNKAEKELEHYKKMLGYGVNEEEMDKMFDLKNIIKEVHSQVTNETNIADALAEKDAFFLHLLALTCNYPVAQLQYRGEFNKISAEFVSKWGERIFNYFEYRIKLLGTLEQIQIALEDNIVDEKVIARLTKIYQETNNKVCNKLTSRLENYYAMGERESFKQQFGFLPDETNIKE